MLFLCSVVVSNLELELISFSSVFLIPPTRPTNLFILVFDVQNNLLSASVAHWGASGGKHWHHVGGGTGRGPWWLACTVGRRPVWFGFGTVI